MRFSLGEPLYATLRGLCGNAVAAGSCRNNFRVCRFEAAAMQNGYTEPA
jgi:hypothetical protein